MQLYKKIAANTLYQILAKIAATGSSFFITLFIARHFGVSDYGDYAKVTAFVSIFYLFVDLGLNSMFLQKEDARLRFRELFYSRILLSVGVVIIANAIGFILPYNPSSHIGFSPLVRLGIAVFSGTLITESILFSTSAVFQRKLIYQSFMVATIIGSLATLILVILFGLLKLPLLFVFIAFLIGAIIEAWFSIFYTEEKLFPISLEDTFVRNLFFETLPVSLLLIFNMIYFRVDMILLSFFKPSADVAFYDLAYRVFDFLIALPLFLSNVLYPKLIADEKNKRNANAKLASYVFIFAVLGGLVAFPMWFISPFIFEFIKPQLTGATIPMHLLLLSLPVFFITNILQWILISKKRQNALAWIYGCLMFSNIVLNVLFIPHYSYVASAIITGVSEAVVALLMLIILFV